MRSTAALETGVALAQRPDLGTSLPVCLQAPRLHRDPHACHDRWACGGGIGTRVPDRIAREVRVDHQCSIENATTLHEKTTCMYLADIQST